MKVVVVVFYLSLLLLFPQSLHAAAAQPSCVDSAEEGQEGYCQNPEAAADAILDVDDSPCRLFLAPSSLQPGRMGAYTSVDIQAGEEIGGSEDPLLVIEDRHKTLPYRGQQRWKPWLDLVQGGLTQFANVKNAPLDDSFQKRPWEDWLRSFDDESYNAEDVPTLDDGVYRLDAIAPGLASTAASTPHGWLVNVQLQQQQREEEQDQDGDLTSVVVALQDIPAGSELVFLDYNNKNPEDRYPPPPPKRALVQTADWLTQNGMCLDHLRVGEASSLSSTPGQKTRGAYARHRLPRGTQIAPVPLAVLLREDLIIYRERPAVPSEDSRTGTPFLYKDVLDKDVILGHEPLLNACLGHSNSSLLLLPLAPAVNWIHPADADQTANAKIQWPEENNGNKDVKDWRNLHPLEVMEQSGTNGNARIWMEIVAVRDIEPGEEILLDYGSEWWEAWNRHNNKQKNEPTTAAAAAAVSSDYVSAADYLGSDGSFTIRTVSEQQQNPYPSNLQTACYFPISDNEEEEEEESTCLLPCSVEARHLVDGTTRYDVSFSYEAHGAIAMRMLSWENCAPEEYDEVWSESIPAESITLLDKWSDRQQHEAVGAFRHEIGVPDGFYPEKWMQPTVYELSPLPASLKPGETVPLTFAHNGQPVSELAYFVGLPQNFSSHLREYLDKQGMLKFFQRLLYTEPTEVGDTLYENLAEGRWFVERPHNLWNSNMNWVYPADEVARKSFLRALGAAGFDDVLAGVGEMLGLNGLVCYDNSFLAVTQSDDSYMHTDMEDSGRKAFNILIPISMVEQEGDREPELDIESSDENVVVSIAYQYDVGVVVGDWTYHKTHAVDYTSTGDMRVTASVYCAEFDEDNVDLIRRLYDEELPHLFGEYMELPIKEWHWRRGEKLLPK